MYCVVWCVCVQYVHARKTLGIRTYVCLSDCMMFVYSMYICMYSKTSILYVQCICTLANIMRYVLLTPYM